MPVLIDPQHVLTELYAISNVPAVVWIDEDDRIVRPERRRLLATTCSRSSPAPSRARTSTRVRAWVRDGTVAMSADEAREAVARPLRRRGAGAPALPRGVSRRAGSGDDDHRAAPLRGRAGELAPMDFTVRRAAMPLIGGDPFGAEFMELFAEWQAAGSPFHGLPPMNTAELTYPEGSDVAASARLRIRRASSGCCRSGTARAARAARGPPA